MHMSLNINLLPQRLHSSVFSLAAGICFQWATRTSGRSNTDVGSDSWLAFQVIPKVLDGVEVWTLCRTVKFFHINLGACCRISKIEVYAVADFASSGIENGVDKTKETASDWKYVKVRTGVSKSSNPSCVSLWVLSLRWYTDPNSSCDWWSTLELG